MIKTVINTISVWTLPVLIGSVLTYATVKKIALYDTFIEGAKEGFNVGVRIIPYLVAILVAVGMFRASGAIDVIANFLAPILSKIGLPADIIPLALIRPLSGSGALGILSEITAKYGGNDFIAKLAAVMVGSTETTFYVLSVYFGSVGVTKFRHAILAGLIADITGMSVAFIICKKMFL